jgi:hypothetical protein
MTPMEPTGGRREYDSDHVDPATRNFVEDRLRETRHDFRNEVAALAAAQAAAALQQTKEHGEVRGAIGDLVNKVEAVARDLSEVLPLRESVEALKRRDEIDDARAEVQEQLLVEVRRQRADTRRYRLAVGGLVIAAIPSATAVIVLFT